MSNVDISIDIESLRGRQAKIAFIQLYRKDELGDFLKAGVHLINDLGLTNFGPQECGDTRWCYATDIEGVDPEELYWKVAGVYKDLFGDQYVPEGTGPAICLWPEMFEPTGWAKPECHGPFFAELAVKGIRILSIEEEAKNAFYLVATVEFFDPKT